MALYITEKMTVQQIMDELKAHGSDSIKKVLLKHGVKEPFFGVKIAYMKPIQKKVKVDYQLAKDLFATGNADAMYLAGLIADDEKMTVTDLHAWVQQAVSTNISEYTVPWVAAGSNYGYHVALQWIDSPVEYVAAAGWSTLSNIVSLKPDNELDIASLKSLLLRVGRTIHQSANRVRSAMNGFLIAVGAYVAGLSEEAIATAKSIGTVIVEKEGTAGKVPDAVEYIMNAKNKGTLGRKKKTVKC